MTGSDPVTRDIEREANEFAMELLMPTAWLRRDLKDGIDIEDAAAIHKLAKKYGVSDTLMTLRIGQLMERR
jgi:Zn-dependent peptidase ImmA (M78 family)